MNVDIIHKHLDYVEGKWIGNEFRPPEYKKKPVDGHIQGTKIVYEYPGDDSHGHPIKGEPHKINRHGTSYGEAFTNTERIFRKLASFGYIIYYVWGNDYKNKPVLTSVKSICRKFNGKLEY